MKISALSLLLALFVFSSSFSVWAQVDPCERLGNQIEKMNSSIEETGGKLEEDSKALEENLQAMNVAEKKAKRRLYVWIAPTVIVGIAAVWATLSMSAFIGFSGKASVAETIVAGLIPASVGGGLVYGGVELMRVPRKKFNELKEEVYLLQEAIKTAQDRLQLLENESFTLSLRYQQLCTE